MKIIPTVLWSREDLSILKEALLPFRLLESFGAQSAIVDAADRSFRALHSGSAWNRDQVQRAFLVLGELSRLLTELSKAKAHPEWVESADKAVGQGLLPFVLNPEKAMRDMAEVRLRQLDACNQGLNLVEEAILRLDDVP